MLGALHVLAQLAATHRPISHLVADYRRYAASGEINLPITGDHRQTLRRVAERESAVGGVIDRTDGLTVRHADGRWFNLRASHTEPLLRLNVEAPTESRMATLRDEVLRVLGVSR